MTYVALLAFPATMAVLAALLRSSLAQRVVAVPSYDRWHERPTPILGGIGIFAGLSAGLWLAVAVGAVDPTRQLLALYGGIALFFVAGVSDLHRRLNHTQKTAS